MLAAEPDGPLGSRARNAVSGLLTTLRDLERLVEGMPTAGAVTSVIENIGYPAYLEKAFPGDHAARAENLEALVSAAQEHDEAGAPEGLAGFLDRVSLRSDADSAQGERGPALMTVHSAKGLEFDAVFVVGLNEELFPHAMSTQEQNGLEEERRLAYVALTRARHKLVLTAARFRYQYGEPVLRDPSRFIREIPDALLSVRSGGESATVRGTRRGPGAAGRPRGRGRSGPTRSGPATPAAGIGRPSGTVTYVAEPGADGGEPFVPGMRVIHPAFGPGRVLATSGSGRRLTLDIRFEAAGRKRILPAYTSLIPG
jgi:DNA helicase-2/ATP-dependent DNA helicase PcrA